MFEDVTVIGAGRAGSTIAARLRERGVRLADDGALRLLCVPDRAIAEVARVDRARPVGRARLRRDAARRARAPRAALLGASAADAHDLGRARPARRRLGGVTAETAEAHERAIWLAETLGLQPFVLADDSRALYHAGASIASNFLVTLYRAAERLFERGRRAAGGARSR